MKKQKLALVVVLLLLCVGLAFSLTSCGEDENIYTKDDVNSLIAELEAALTEKATENEAAIGALKAEYTAKVAELEKANRDNESAIATLNASYTAKVAELEIADKANADALAKLKADYEADLTELQKADGENKAAIESLTSTYESKVAELVASDKSNADALTALKTEYETDLAELQNSDSENKAAIESLTSTYEGKVAELEASDKANADALDKLRTEYENAVLTLNASILSNTEKITVLEANMLSDIAELKSTYDEKISNIEALIVSLQETDTDNIKRIVALEVQMAELFSKHEHIFGIWVECEGVFEHEIAYRICKECKELQWRGKCITHTFSVITTPPTCTEQGYDINTCMVCGLVEFGNYTETAPHAFVTVTTAPTCISQGYDTKTCSDCGFVEVDNYTNVVAHMYSEQYSFDSTHHWFNCLTCDIQKNEYEEHSVGDNGNCNKCNQPLSPTSGIVYMLSTDGTYAEVVDYAGSATNICIASEYEGVPVTAIKGGAFRETDIVRVFVPDSIASIGVSAFYGCDALISIYLSDGVESIGDNAFQNCYNLNNVIIPNSVISIGNSAFRYCTSFTDITIPYGVTSIGSYTFSFCENLTNITIPDSLEYVGYAFEDCVNLVYNAFDNAYYLGNETNPYVILVKAKSSDIAYCAIHEDTKHIYKNAFSNCESLTNITIPDNVKSIGDDAFYACKSLTELTIGKNVKSIGGYAFAYCYSLTSVTIPENVTNIYGKAFFECINITEIKFNAKAMDDVYSSIDYFGNAGKQGAGIKVTFGKNVTKIPTYLFYSSYTPNIKIVEFEKGSLCTKIGEFAFYRCDSIKRVYYGGTAEEWNNIYNNSSLNFATLYYYSETEPELNADGTAYDGNYWYYDENNEISIWVK